MEDKLRALESPDTKVVTGALFGLSRQEVVPMPYE